MQHEDEHEDATWDSNQAKLSPVHFPFAFISSGLQVNWILQACLTIDGNVLNLKPSFVTT